MRVDAYNDPAVLVYTYMRTIANKFFTGPVMNLLAMDTSLYVCTVYLAPDIVEAEHLGAQAPPDVPQRTALNFKYNTCYNTTYLAKLERL